METYKYPLIFEPGEGHCYGPGLDWAGLIVRKSNGNISLKKYFLENIFKPVGITKGPFPTFDVNRSPEAKSWLLETALRNGDFTPEPGWALFAEDAADNFGGSGLACSFNQHLAVLADLITDFPTILELQSPEALFTPAYNDLQASHYV